MYLWIAIGGLAGTFARFGFQGLVQSWTGAGFPWGTFAVNVTGSLLIGFLGRLGTGSALLGPDVRAGLLIGFCGAYTTFSTFSFETLTLLQSGAYLRAGAYAVGTVVASLTATVAGIGAANQLL
jgi:fluoride exporter